MANINYRNILIVIVILGVKIARVTIEQFNIINIFSSPKIECAIFVALWHGRRGASELDANVPHHRRTLVHLDCQDLVLKNELNIRQVKYSIVKVKVQ